MSDEMPAWAATMQSALAEAISDFRREVNGRFDKIDQTLEARFAGEQVNTAMVEVAERHAKEAREDVASLTNVIHAQQKRLLWLEGRISALEGKQ
jgi:hypothetical protein